ncbi:MAG: energy-coupling factor transporter ATPase [Clostridia bacterium]|nr:energy-coupling factor transporter ATPase [Clostridia bacterium]
MSVLEVRDLTYTYSPKTPFEKTALDNVSLSVETGELVGIIGHTGSGKSTLVQHLNGLLRPTAGQVLLDGKDIWAEPKKIRQVRFRVGMVFQYPEHQLFEETVYKDIAFGPKNMGLSDSVVDARVKEAAEAVELRAELLEKSPFELSGGQKRRAAIAGVMAMEPEVLILDEPTAGLDPKGRDRILRLVSRYREVHHTTVLLVSHSMEDVARTADRVLVMSKAHVAMFDDTTAVFSRAEELAAIGLTVPAVTRIWMELRRRGMDVGDNVFTVEQAVARLLPLLKGGDGGAH